MKPEKRNLQNVKHDRDYLQYDKGYNHCHMEWEDWIQEADLYVTILDVQEDIEKSGQNIGLLQSHRKILEKTIKEKLLKERK